MVYRLRDVEVIRERGGARFRLKIPNFEVGKASFTAIIGQSGCGKSTLLDILGLVLPPNEVGSFALTTEGKERLEVGGMGQSLLAAIRRHHIGYILQSGGLMPFLSVAGNLRLARLLNPSKALDEEGARKVVETLGLGEQLGKKPAHLSGGQRQRAAIARTVIQNPEVLLADEPTGAVDQFNAREIRDLLLEECARKRKMAVIIVTHDEGLVRDHADAIYTFEVSKKGDALESKLVKSK